MSIATTYLAIILCLTGLIIAYLVGRVLAYGRDD